MIPWPPSTRRERTAWSDGTSSPPHWIHGCVEAELDYFLFEFVSLTADDTLSTRPAGQIGLSGGCVGESSPALQPFWLEIFTYG